jgi:hypothetical protein
MKIPFFPEWQPVSWINQARQPFNSFYDFRLCRKSSDLISNFTPLTSERREAFFLFCAELFFESIPFRRSFSYAIKTYKAGVKHAG